MQINEQADNTKEIEAFLDYAIENNFLDGVEIEDALVKLRSDAEQANLCFDVTTNDMHKEIYYIDENGAEKAFTELIDQVEKGEL